jgi:glycolate oxidase FAD binding subunit
MREVEAALAERGQMFAFEPPHFGPNATLGGCVASGFSGPRRAAAGSARDFVLGVRMLNAKGDDMQFGGRVMKNVAGFDVSRLMAGTFGTLGLMLDISLKVLPRPESEASLRYELNETTAIQRMNEWAAQPVPITGTCWCDGALTIRLSGAAPAVTAARAKLGGDALPDSDVFWTAVREQTLPSFQDTLWRVSAKSSAPPLRLSRGQVIEWNGSLRWLAGECDGPQVLEAARRAGGHATLFRGGDRSAGIFQLDTGVLAIHKRLKAALDPLGIFGPGRLHPEF